MLLYTLYSILKPAVETIHKPSGPALGVRVRVRHRNIKKRLFKVSTSNITMYNPCAYNCYHLAFRQSWVASILVTSSPVDVSLMPIL